MNRNPYYDYIDKHLHINAHRIETAGKLNLLNLHSHSENFYLHFFNLLYDFELINLNDKIQNVEAIDLIDHKNNLIVQVSATCTKQKIEKTLEKDIFKSYPTYSFKFISISRDATTLRTNTFKNPHSIAFNPSTDIYDLTSILRNILSFDPFKMKKVYEFINAELGSEIDIIKLDSNLAKVINILATQNWDDANKSDTVNLFEIDRKISFNDLDEAKGTIEEYSLFHDRVASKYSEFDSLGLNKSNSVLASIRRKYINLKHKENADDVFRSVIEDVKTEVLSSLNFDQIPIDELELCVDILVVDAFIRCKIFQNPDGYNYAST
uniref:ABC-three component system protein n=1 Tax=Roseivirga sp. TaxID=1964215 RepID=UPI0040488699